MELNPPEVDCRQRLAGDPNFRSSDFGSLSFRSLGGHYYFGLFYGPKPVLPMFRAFLFGQGRQPSAAQRAGISRRAATKGGKEALQRPLAYRFCAPTQERNRLLTSRK